MADSKDGSEKDRNEPTVRDLAPRALSSDTVPDVVGQYAPPRPLPEVSQHRTLDLRSVRLSSDPSRRAPTERRLVAPARVERTESKSGTYLLIGGLVVLVGVGAWLLFRPQASSNEPARAPVTLPATPAPIVGAPPARVTTSPVVAPVAPSASEPGASRDSAASSAEKPAPPSAAPKPPAPRDPEKKRREPWLE